MSAPFKLELKSQVLKNQKFAISCSTTLFCLSCVAAAKCQESNQGLLPNFQPPWQWPISQTLMWKNAIFTCTWMEMFDSQFVIGKGFRHLWIWIMVWKCWRNWPICKHVMSCRTIKIFGMLGHKYGAKSQTTNASFMPQSSFIVQACQ